MKTRTSKALGATAGIAAIAFSVPLAVTAYADPPAPAPEQPAEPTTTAVVEIPNPEGKGCDAFKEAVPDWKALNNLPVGQALQAIPDASTFYSAISGGFNPAVNVVPVLENGPYVVFVPTNEAFAALAPAQLDALKANPAALTDFDYYHVFLGMLGPKDVKGQRPTQQGAEIKVTGENADVTINDTAKVVCGGIQAANARIYLIDAVLDPANAPEAVTPSATSTSETTTTQTTTETTEPAAPAEPTPAADAPIG
ncbi:fasciclin [Mycolicibacterium novocastrense]|uniref:fasciclin domain-containing protein n=1 Tax=Mycolicibacterium novocastrense TaxID=59813 RepID=UPI0007467CFC|nr:fasciclin domain-containing protein [Mycolicibacterium novocastrense]KUH76673.1 fasciclin [Mycolicibacterium novocastrense]KUH77996.1 fasciclin [Mycolicibacterium novocastrense]KUH79330.1 fasciclin [Mycolicibacterium novocastrense]